MTDRTLLQYVIDHPNIEHCVLIYAWNQRVCREHDLDDHTSFVERFSYCRKDPEYTCIGDRADLIEFAENYSVWDGFLDDLRIDVPVLTGFILAYDCANPDSYDSEVDGDLYFDGFSSFRIVDPYVGDDWSFDFHRRDLY